MRNPLSLQHVSNRYRVAQFYDVEFYPYTVPGVDPVFAVTGRANVRTFLVY